MSHKIYRIPGMGADKRLFAELTPIDGYEFVDLEWRTNYTQLKSLKEYAFELSKEIDTTQPFSLLGVSMGGMICSELADLLTPQKVIIISSCKTSSELPTQLKRLKFIGITRLLKAERIRYLIGNASRFFGAMNKEQRQLFYSMAENINIDFIAWSIKAIVNWKKKNSHSTIIHLHGDKDMVLPFKNIEPNAHLIKNGDHMMIWNKSEEINKILATIFS